MQKLKKKKKKILKDIHKKYVKSIKDIKRKYEKEKDTGIESA